MLARVPASRQIDAGQRRRWRPHARMPISGKSLFSTSFTQFSKQRPVISTINGKWSPISFFTTVDRVFLFSAAGLDRQHGPPERTPHRAVKRSTTATLDSPILALFRQAKIHIYVAQNNSSTTLQHSTPYFRKLQLPTFCL